LNLNDIRVTEFHYICSKAFNLTPPPYVVNQYVTASAQGVVTDNNCRNIDVGFLVDNQLDIVSVEFFCRTFVGDNLLTRKLKLAVYLLEISAQIEVDREESAFFTAFYELTKSLVISILKLAGGGLMVYLYKRSILL